MSRRMSSGLFLGLVIALVVVGGSGLLAIATPHPAFSAAPAGPAAPEARASTTPAPTVTRSVAPAAAAPAAVPAATTHGDLVVLSGETFVIQPTLSGHTY